MSVCMTTLILYMHIENTTHHYHYTNRGVGVRDFLVGVTFDTSVDLG